MALNPVPGPKRVKRAEDLFDLLADHPEGLNLVQIGQEIGVPVSVVRTATRDLRRMLGDTDTANLVCEPAGRNEQWAYRLVGNLEEARWWQTNRLGDSVTRIETVHAVARSIKAGYSGTPTVESRSADLIVKVLGRLIEDLADLQQEVDA